MKKIVVLTLVLYSFSGFSQQYQRYLVDTMASPYFDGRGYVNEGANRAADFIVKQFRYLKLSPVNGSFKQVVPMQVNTFPGKMELKIDGIKLTPGVDYLVDPISGGGTALAKAARIDVFNKTQMKKLMGTQKYSDNILVVRRPDTLKGESSREFNLVVQALGDMWAVVVLTNEKLTWGVGTKSTRFPVFWVNKPGLNKVKIIAYEVEQKLENIKSNNVMAMVKGTGNNKKYLVVTAHYDHLGRMGSETVFPGANDNASGVAEMLALAAYFSKNPLQKNIIFVAFTGEEAGLVGSKYFVNNPPVPLDSIDFVLNLDLSGTGDEGITVVNATLYAEVFEQLVDLNSEGNFVAKVKKRGPAANSDHYFFTDKGVPAFFIYTLGGIKAYHDVYDLAETLPLTEVADLKQLYIRFFKYLDSVGRPKKEK